MPEYGKVIDIKITTAGATRRALDHNALLNKKGEVLWGLRRYGKIIRLHIVI